MHMIVLGELMKKARGKYLFTELENYRGQKSPDRYLPLGLEF